MLCWRNSVRSLNPQPSARSAGEAEKHRHIGGQLQLPLEGAQQSIAPVTTACHTSMVNNPGAVVSYGLQAQSDKPDQDESQPSSGHGTLSFAELQQRLSADVDNTDGSAVPWDVLVVPSLNLDAQQIALVQGVHHYEERQLFELIRPAAAQSADGVCHQQIAAGIGGGCGAGAVARRADLPCAPTPQTLRHR